MLKLRPLVRAAPALKAARPAKRSFRAMSAPLRAQAEKPPQEEESKGLAKQSPQGPATLSPFGEEWGFPTSFGRMSQMMRDLESEMNAMTRAFGMPSLRAFDRAFDLDLPALPSAPPAARALACDVQDKGDHIEVAADVPGMSKEDIKVTISPDKVLTISGERKYEKEEGKQGEGVWRVERSFGSFMRRFRLPDNVDPEGVKASVKDGVLKLTVPKTEEAKLKEIEVNLSED